jgi:hypothetical protein
MTAYGYAAEEIYEVEDFEEFDESYVGEDAYGQEDDDPSNYGGDSWEEISMAEGEEANYVGPDGEEAEPDPSLEEAYATYLDASRQFADLRGLYPIVAL